MEAYTNTMKYNHNLFDWLKHLPLKEEQDVQIIVLPITKVQNNNSDSILEKTVLNNSESFEIASENETPNRNDRLTIFRSLIKENSKYNLHVDKNISISQLIKEVSDDIF